jgi:hypothetical protein
MRSALAGLRPSADFSFDNFALRPKPSSRFGHGKTSHNPSRYVSLYRGNNMKSLYIFCAFTLSCSVTELPRNFENIEFTNYFEFDSEHENELFITKDEISSKHNNELIISEEGKAFLKGLLIDRNSWQTNYFPVTEVADGVIVYGDEYSLKIFKNILNFGPNKFKCFEVNVENIFLDYHRQNTTTHN